MQNGVWADRTPYRKIIILTAVVFASIVIMSTLGFILMKPLFGLNALTDARVLSNLQDQNVINALKFLQMCNAIGMFILPSLFYIKYVTNEGAGYLQLKPPGQLLQFLIALLLIVCAQPLIAGMAELNSHLKLPTVLKGVEKWMRTSEESSAVVIGKFLVMPTLGALLYTLFLIALLPGFGEELLFRGILQKLLKEQTGNIHWGIILTGIVFSAIHMQFYGFLPRAMMGIAFGYLFLWSKSLWVPVLAHFVNNGMSVVLSYVTGENATEDSMSHSLASPVYLIISVVLVGVLMFWSYRIREKES